MESTLPVTKIKELAYDKDPKQCRYPTNPATESISYIILPILTSPVENFLKDVCISGTDERGTVKAI